MFRLHDKEFVVMTFSFETLSLPFFLLSEVWASKRKTFSPQRAEQAIIPFQNLASVAFVRNQSTRATFLPSLPAYRTEFSPSATQYKNRC